MAEMLLGNTRVSDETKTECCKFWVEGQGWTELEKVPPALLAEAVKLLLKEKNAAHALAADYKELVDRMREVLEGDE